MKKYGWIILLFVFLLPVIWPLLRSGFFSSDDGEWMVIRLTALHQALASGQFPARFAYRLNFGYGYPIFNFAYPGSFYLAEIFYLLGFSAVSSVKLIFSISILLSGLFTFLWLKSKFSGLASFLGSMLYVYSPYFLWDIYKRGSLGEVFFLALIPLFLWSAEMKKWLAAGFVFGLLIISHNVLALIFSPVLIFYFFLAHGFTSKVFRSAFLTIFLSLVLSAFFWVPALWESRLTVLSQTLVSDPLDHLVENPILLGLINLAVFFLAIGLFLKKKGRLLGFFLAVFSLALFFSTGLSTFFWQIFPWSFLIQYPFRFLSLTLPAAAFLGAFIFDRTFKKRRVIWFVLTLLVLFYTSLPFAKPKEFFDKNENFYLTNEHSTAIHNEYTPIWVKVAPLERAKEKIEVFEGQAVLKNFKDDGRTINFESQAEEPSLIRVNVLYYPGWQVLVDGKRSVFSIENEKGVIEIPLSKGQHQVRLVFKETPSRLFADLISLSSLIFVGGWLVKKRRI